MMNSAQATRCTLWKTSLLTLSVLAIFLTSGCKSPVPHHILVTRTREVQDQSAQIWIGPGNTLQQTAMIREPVDNVIELLKKTVSQYNAVLINFTNQTTDFQKPQIPRKSSKWAEWLSKSGSNSDSIVVIADLPGKTETAGIDARRRVIPLSRRSWRHLKDDVIRVEVGDKGIDLLTVPSP